MHFRVAVTDAEFCEQFSRSRPDEVNFWSPGSRGVCRMEEN